MRRCHIVVLIIMRGFTTSHGVLMARNDATVGRCCSSVHDDYLRNVGANKPARDIRMRVFGTSPKIDGKWGNGHETLRG